MDDQGVITILDAFNGPLAAAAVVWLFCRQSTSSRRPEASDLDD
jgi:hypothetical protein